MRCSCKKFESFGIPCCHQITVMKYERLTYILTSLVMKRWTRHAMEVVGKDNQSNISKFQTQTARYGILSLMSNEYNYYASSTPVGFNEALNGYVEGTLRVNLVSEENMETANPRRSLALFGVRDLKKVKTKGYSGPTVASCKHRKPRHCGKCKMVGHIVKICPKLKCREFRDSDDAASNDPESMKNVSCDAKPINTPSNTHDGISNTLEQVVKVEGNEPMPCSGPGGQFFHIVEDVKTNYYGHRHLSVERGS